MASGFTLSPLTATLLLVLMLVSGRMFRDAWKQRPSRWAAKCWAYGLVSFAAFVLLAFVRLEGTAH